MKTTQLGLLEQDIMNILWDKKHCCVREVLLALQQHRTIAYTTVATVMQRLSDKQLLTRKEVGKNYIYTPALSKEIYSKNVIKSSVIRLMSTYGDIAIITFAETIDSLPKKKRDQLFELLEK